MKRRDFLKVLGAALVAPVAACRTLKPEPKPILIDFETYGIHDEVLLAVDDGAGPHFDLDFDRAKRDPVYYVEHVWNEPGRVNVRVPAGVPFSAEDFIRAYNGLPAQYARGGK